VRWHTGNDTGYRRLPRKCAFQGLRYSCGCAPARTIPQTPSRVISCASLSRVISYTVSLDPTSGYVLSIIDRRRYIVAPHAFTSINTQFG